MKKPIVTLWLLGILVLCLPLSYLINVKQNTYKSEEDFMMLVLVCAPVAFLFIGGLSWIAYYFMKRNKRATAVRDALLVFTGLVVGVSAVTAPEAAKKMEKRKRFLGRDEFIQGCVKGSGQTLLPILKGELEDPEQTLENYCTCMFDKMDADPEVSEIIFDASVSNEEFDKHPRVREITNECRSEMMKELLKSAE